MYSINVIQRFEKTFWIVRIATESASELEHQLGVSLRNKALIRFRSNISLAHVY